MKKRIVLPLIIILFFISACSLKELGLKDEERKPEDEKVGLYDKEFIDQSENWEVKLHLRELSETWSSYRRNQAPYEEDTLTIKYLKEIDEGLGFQYDWIYGDPMRGGIGAGYRITLQNQAEFIDTAFQQRMIEEVCFGTLTLKIHWEDQEGESQEESFVFQDDQNPQCEHIVIMAPRSNLNW